MFIVVVFLTFLTTSPGGVYAFHTCVPYTQFVTNGRLCYCNSAGRWTENSCQNIARRQICQPGQIIWEECSQCICQENGKLLCTNTQCSEDLSKNNTAAQIATEIWCTPFRSYYINCSLCMCPASGRMAEARCAVDSSCTLKGPLSLDIIVQNVCIPKVMYLFTCLQCLCADIGFFVKSKCVETCHRIPEPVKRCIPRTFYKSECNVCHCPDNGIHNNSLCTKSICSRSSKMESLDTLTNRSDICVKNKFTTPKCYYCECSPQGTINEHTCHELECLKINDYYYGFFKNTCTPGEIVPICTECFCTSKGFANGKYCTKVCSLQNKLLILENILKSKSDLIDYNALIERSGVDTCDPNSVFLNHGRFCLCPDNGNANFKFCLAIVEAAVTPKPKKATSEMSVSIDFTAHCKPNTYVEFNCNSCYCNKHGKIDPKWCTYDNCETKRIVQEIHKSRPLLAPSETSETCVPGSVYKLDCNFCICSESGMTKEGTCTKNICTNDHMNSHVDFVCEPSVYYMVDCNICFCPSDGIKNLQKCTKNQCESNFLRTESCVPGTLFSDDCNICVCPPNGDKNAKVCTNRTCADSDTPWKKIFKLSQSLLGNQMAEDTTRNLDLCFPGEEYVMGCKVCVCPEMGLREYATCTSMLCNEETGNIPQSTDEDKAMSVAPVSRVKRQTNYCPPPHQLPTSSERMACTPGSMYIIRCQQCICPYMGTINYFCRPMPEGKYCEQAYPNYNYLPMGRRAQYEESLKRPKTHEELQVSHNHTFYKCEEPGTIEDSCYICQCEPTKFLVIEHCFKSDHDSCKHATPSFLTKNNKLVT